MSIFTKRTWLRFGLRSIFVLTAVTAMGAAYVGGYRRAHLVEQKIIQKLQDETGPAPVKVVTKDGKEIELFIAT